MKLQDCISKVTVNTANSNKLANRILKASSGIVVQQNWANTVTEKQYVKAFARTDWHKSIERIGSVYVLNPKMFLQIKYFDFKGKRYIKPLSDTEVIEYIQKAFRILPTINSLTIR